MTFILILLNHIDYVHKLIGPLILYYLILLLILQVGRHTLTSFLINVIPRHHHGIELSIIFLHIFTEDSNPPCGLRFYLWFIELLLNMLNGAVAYQRFKLCSLSRISL
jgi:hypothetical protein